jgi:hypothetical protein
MTAQMWTFAVVARYMIADGRQVSSDRAPDPGSGLSPSRDSRNAQKCTKNKKQKRETSNKQKMRI